MKERCPTRQIGPTKSSKGRPRRFDREVALQKAMHLFWDKGYTATSLADLTSEMGITPPSFYAAFGSKEDIYAEALNYYQKTYTDKLWEKFDNAPTLYEAVEIYLVSAIALYCGKSELPHPPGCMLALSTAGNEGNTYLGKTILDDREKALRRFENRIEKAISDGEISKEKSSGLARFIIAVLGGISLQARDGTNYNDLKEVIKITLSTLKR